MKKCIRFLIFILLFVCFFTGCTISNTNQPNENPDNIDCPEEESNEKEPEEMKYVNVYVKNQSLVMELQDNQSAKAFYQKLLEEDIVISMSDYGNFEKVGELGFTLPRSDKQITTSPGDVVLYLGSSITIYYDTNSWNFTLLGRIKDMTRSSMLEFLGGSGNTTVRFSLQ